MAAVGSTQQREVTELETRREIKSLEREISDLLNEQNTTKRESKNIDKAILNDVNKKYAAVEDLTRKQIVAQQNILREQMGVFAARDAAAEQRAKDMVTVAKFEAKKLAIERELAEMDLKIANDQLNISKKINEEENKRSEKALDFLGKYLNIFNVQSKWYKVLRDSVGLTGKKLWLWSGIVAVVLEAFEAFKKIDDALAKFRISMGMMRKDAARISSDILDVATRFTHVGVTVDIAADSARKLAEEFGGTMKVSKDLVENAALLKAQLGVSEDITAGFLRNLAGVSDTTAQANINMTYLTQTLTAAAGIPLNLVMQDVAKLSGTALSLVSKIPIQLVKAATAARQMGTSLNKMADAGANILNFTESVQSEMEASVLIGEGVNVQLARELAYRGKLVEATKVMVTEAKRLGFVTMDYFQKRAFASAFGYDPAEVTKILQAEKQLAAARNRTELKSEVALYEKLMRSREADLKNEGLQTELGVKRLANQARLTALQQQWNQLIMEVTTVLFPVIDGFLKLGIIMVKLGPALSILIPTLRIVSVATFLFNKAWAAVHYTMGLAFSTIKSFSRPIAKLLLWVGNLGAKFSWIGKIFSALKFAAPFVKIVPVIGWIIAGFQFVYNLFKRFGEIDFVKGDWVGNIWKGIKAVGFALYDTLLSPFVDVYNWVMKWLGGHSPSFIAISMVKGIASVAPMIFNALISPWKMFLAWIVEKIPFFGKRWATAIRGGELKSKDMGIGEKQGTLESKPAVKPEATFTPSSAVLAVAPPEEQKRREQDSTMLSEILKSLNQLNSNLLSGKIGLYIDGQLMSATVARQTAFKGGYGMNQVSIG